MHQEIEEKGVWPNWQPIGGYGGYSTDMYGRTAPTSNELIQAFQGTVFACASLIADKISSTEIRLYAKTAPGQAKPKCQTAPVFGKKLLQLQKAKSLHRSITVEEVTDHPVLQLLNQGNSFHNRLDLLQLTSLFQDTTGNAFWLKKFDDFGLPVALFLLPTQHMQPARNDAGMVDYWKFGTGDKEARYSLNEIIHFKIYPNLSDPYCWGLSPLQASWARNSIESKELGFLEANLSNFGRPDAVLSPKDEEISQVEAERIAKDFIQRFRGQGAGGVFVAPSPMTLTPLQWSAKDFAEMQLFQTVRNAISNAYHIPPDIWELGQSNRSTSDAILYSLAVHAISPRITHLVEKLNERLLCHYDERLFFAADDVVPEDKAFEMQEVQMLLATGTITRGEVRKAYGLDAQEWAEEPLLPPGSMPASALQEEETPLQPLPVPEEQPAPDRSGQAPSLAALQQSVYGGTLPREAAIANVMLTYGFSKQEAEALFPEIAPVKLSPEQEQPVDQEQPHKAVSRTKAIKQKSPQLLAKALQRVFRLQEQAAMQKLTKALGEYETKAVGDDWLDVEQWTRAMYRELKPTVALYYDFAAQQTVGRLGGSFSLMAVVQPKLKEGVEKSTLLFCQETNETTKKEIGSALTLLRQEIAEGLEEGEAKNQMMRRVQNVFEDATNERSWRIAVTESSRAQHASQTIVARESGLVKGYKWLLSSEACALCKSIAAEKPETNLDEPFARIGDGPYSEIMFPPAHPTCRCTTTMVLNDEGE